MTIFQQEQQGTNQEQHEIPARIETDKKASLASSSGGIFSGYFSAERKWKFKKDDLLDARGRRLFESTAMACAADAYPFRLLSTVKPGRW